MVLLDTKHRILGTRTVYQGSVNQAQVRVAEVHRREGPPGPAAIAEVRSPTDPHPISRTRAGGWR